MEIHDAATECLVAAGKVSGGEEVQEGTRSRGWLERVNFIFLGLGKIADIAVDWVMYRELAFTMIAEVTGCTNTCEGARNFVCQDGESITSTSAALGIHACSAAGNFSVLPAACAYGTDCDDCGPRAPLVERLAFPEGLALAALVIAIAGTSIELVAGYLKARLIKEHQGQRGRYLVHSVRLNRRLAWPRFLLDDLPATVLSIYILAVFPEQASTLTVVLLVVSIVYSLFAMAYHVLRKMAGGDVQVYKELKQAGVTLEELESVGLLDSGSDAANASRAGFKLVMHHLVEKKKEAVLKALLEAYPDGAKEKDGVRGRPRRRLRPPSAHALRSLPACAPRVCRVAICPT